MCRGREPGDKVTYLSLFIRSGTYHYTVVACQFVEAVRVGLALVVTIILLIAAVEGAEVVFMNFIASQDISDEFQGGGLADTSLSDKKDSASRVVLDDTLFERRYVARRYS